MFDDFEGFGGAGGAATNEALANTGSVYRLNQQPTPAHMIQPAPAYSPNTLQESPQKSGGLSTVSSIANAASQVQGASKKDDGGGFQKILSVVGTVAAFL